MRGKRTGSARLRDGLADLTLGSRIFLWTEVEDGSCEPGAS